MTERLFNYQQEPRPFGMKTRRLNAVTRILLAIFAMMLIPQSTWADEVNYYRYDGAKFVEDKVDTYTTLFGKTNNSDEYPLTAGVTYVVPSLSSGDPVEYRGRLVISSGTVNIILCDGATLKAQRGIEVSAAATLNIFGQEKGTGQLIAEGNYYNVFESANAIRYYAYAPIGGSHTNYNSTNAGTLSKCGTIVIHGGIITANSSGTGSAANAAGIGGCDSEGPLALTVYGGKVTATGGQYSAGIGGGGVGQAGGTVSIYGGEVIATGGEGDASNVVAMGIGRGSVSNTAISGPSEGSLTINAGVYYYAGTTANPTNQMADTGTRFQYMKTIRTYDLWLGKNMFAAGTQVTAANASDLLGSLAGATGSMSFSPNTNTLVLNNAAFGQNIISGLDDLTIEFSGANSIILDGDTGTIIRSDNENATLTFKHTGTADSLYLRHYNDSESNNFSIISGFKTIDYSTAGLYMKSLTPTKYVSHSVGNTATLMSLLSAASRLSRRTDTGSESIEYPCINSATITTTQTYPVWVKGIQVTSDNINNILNTATPTVYYDVTNKILTLDGANIDYTGTDRNAVVSGIKDLKVLLLNNNVISIKSNINFAPWSRIFNYAFQYYAGTDGSLTFVLDEANRSSLGQLTIENMEDPTSATDPQVAIGCAPFVAFGSIQQSVADLTNTGSGWIKTTATTPNNGITLSYSPDNYNLWVAGKQVNSFNASNVFAGDATNDGKVIFTPDASTLNSGTLTLNGMSKDGTIVSNLANLTIELKGENELTGTSGYIESQNTSASLTIKKGANDSKLSLTNSTGSSAVGGFASVTLEDVYLSASNCCTYDGSAKAYKYPATDAVGAFNVQDLTFTTDVYYPLWVESQQFSAKKSTINWLDGGTASFVSGTTNTLTLTGVAIDSSNGIESALPNLTILLDGNNSVKTNTAYHWNPIYSADGTAALTIQKAATATGCSLSLSTNDDNVQVVKGFSSVSFPDYLTFTKTAGTGTTLDDAATYGATLTITAYPLWVGNTQVNVLNAADVFSDGKVSYVHDATNNTGTLTLDAAQLNGDIATSMSDLTIHIKNDCRIIAGSNCIRSSAATPGTLTFTKENGGILALNNATNHYSVIKGFQTLAGLPLETQAPYEIYDNGNYYSLKQKLASDTSSIDYAWVNADTTYPLWVDGHQATSASANNIMDTEDVDGNPIATYASNTLTLTNAIIAGSIVSNIPSLTISLLGNSEVSSGILTSDATTNLTIAKNAGAAGQVSLLVQSSSTAPAIKSFNSLTYTGFTPFDDDGTTDLTSSISYSSEARALQSNGNDLTGVKFVSKISLEEAGLSFAMDSKVYTGSAVVLPGTVTMTKGTTETTLTEGTHYTVTGYKDANGTALTGGAPTDHGDYIATILGKGDYMGTVDVPFTITPKAISDASVSVTVNGTYTYTGSAVEPPTGSIVVKDGTTPLVDGTDYTISYNNNVAAGTAAEVIITGKGNYSNTSTKTQTFTIGAKAISDASISVTVNGTYTYTGSAVEPPTGSIVVKDGTTPLVDGDRKSVV